MKKKIATILLLFLMMSSFIPIDIYKANEVDKTTSAVEELEK